MPRIRTESRVEKLVRIYDFLALHGPVSAYHVGMAWGASPKHFSRWMQALMRAGVVEVSSHRPHRWRISRNYTDRTRAVRRIGECGASAVLLRGGRVIPPSARDSARARTQANTILDPNYLATLSQYFDEEEN